MSDPAVCPNCTKMVAALLDADREAYNRGVDDVLQVLIKGLDILRSRGREVPQFEELIQVTGSNLRAERKG